MKQGIDRLFYHAPVLVICHVDPAESTFPKVEAGLSAMQMIMIADALGLGSCFCGFFILAVENSLDLRRFLNIPKEHQVPFSFLVGYPDVQFLRTVSRKSAKAQWF